jgi:hypothetical protein
MSYNKEIARMFAEKIMDKMEDALALVWWETEDTNNRKFELVKSIASLTSELLDSDEINDEMIKIAESSKVNGDNIKDKFDTFLMIRNVINHFSIFESWDEIYVSKELLNWNNPKYSMIKKYFKSEKNMSYRIYLNEGGNWVEKKKIDIKVPKLEEDNKVYLKDIISLDDVIWTFSSIDYYLQYLDLNIMQRFMVSL